MTGTRGRIRLALLVGALGTALLAPAPAGASADPPQVVTPAARFATAFAASVADPGASPRGVNPTSCRRTAAHRHPVVLVNGTFTTMLSSFGYLGPRLARAGYCAYGYNYGGVPTSPIQAVGPVVAGVHALALEVRRVKRQTGARKVDLVGYSQGGLISELYAKHPRGAASVHSITALAPTTHGTTLLGFATLAAQVPGALDVVRTGCAACSDQVVGSPVIQSNEAGGVTVPGIAYSVIDTRFEDVATPAGTATFIAEPGVTNVFVQDRNGLDTSEHVELPFSGTTAELVLEALARAA